MPETPTEIYRKLSIWGKLARTPAVFIDGALYTLIAMIIPIQAMLSTDEAAKYLSPQFLWWMRIAVGGIAGGLGGLKMFRSSSYADHLHKANGNPTIATK